ncbi:MAG TPA: carboxypeptidase-like regulatory domain-containing protein [Blastocatellia bacterium]|nr:carboxypeptidase-like regulatory domain-containing protein [Blastocatellia bacterium]
MGRSSVSRLIGRGFVIFIFAMALTPVLGQTGANTGLTGRVADPNGASIVGATVTLTKVDTGERRTVKTNSDGDWEARFLSPGTYRLVFEGQGFKKLARDGVTVTTAEMVVVNVRLEVGALDQVVEVTANAEMGSSGSATIVRTLDRKELEGLPTSARNFTQLLVIEPGVSADISELLSNDNASISPSVNGARTTNNSFVFNGVDVTNLLCCNSRINGSRGTIDEGGGTLSRNIAPALETLQEVKLQTSLYDAATGRNGGGNFQLVSKSGTNGLHGSVYHFFQNDKLIANDFFFNRSGLDRPILRRNEGGGTIGGPIIKNKTFFFGSYQFTRAKTSFVDEASNTVRMPKDLTDDRSDEGINRFAAAIWNAARNGPINFAVINPISRSLLKAKFSDGSYLIPSGANGINCARVEDQVADSCQVVSVIPATFKQDQFSVNIDHQLTQANKLSGKFYFSNQPSRDPLANGDALTRFEREETTFQRTFSLTDVHIFGPRLVNEFRAGFFRNRNDSVPVAYFNNADFGIQNPFASEVPDLSQIEIEGDEDVGSTFRFGTPGDGTRIFDVQNTFTFGNTLSFARGKHSFRVGGELRRHQLNGALQETRNRRHNIKSWFDFLTVGYRNPADRNRARQIDDSSLNYGETVRGYRMTDWSWFVADDWKVTPKFTLNVGLRHEFFGFPSEVNGLISVFDFPAALATGNVQDGFIFPSNFKPASIAGAAGLNLRVADSKSIIPGDFNNLMPRVGFAWSPLESKRIILRGGYGVFFERTTGAFANSLRQAAPFFRESQLNDLGDWNTIPRDIPVFPIPSFGIGFDDGEPFLVGSNDPGNEFEAFETQMISPDLATPYIQQWNLNAQWEFKPNWLIEVGYVGSKGTKLLQLANQNQALDIDKVGLLRRAGVPGGGFTGNYFQVVNDRFVNVKTPPPGCDIFDDPDECVIPAELRGPLLGLDEDEGANTVYSNANSIYHSLQTSLQKRFSRGYMFNVNYTFSRSLDTFSDEGLFQIEHDQTRPHLNRGLSDFHRKHRLILSWTWELPFKGNRFVEGWQLSGIGTFQSGRPFTVVDDDFSGILFSSTSPRPSLATGDTHKDQTTNGSVTSRLDEYLNRDAFQSSGVQFGTLGRNTVIGPDQRRVDISVSKMTRLTEGVSLEFRAEAYNVSNTPTFRNPARDLSGGNFGEITRTRGGPRVIQLGLKLRF